MEANGGIREAVRQLERRQAEADVDRREVWREQAKMATTLATQTVELTGLREDFKEVADRLSWTTRALWSATGTFTVLILSAIGLALSR